MSSRLIHVEAGVRLSFFKGGNSAFRELTTFFYLPSINGHLGCFHLLVVTNAMNMNGQWLSFLLGVCSEELLDHMVVPFSFLWGTAILLSTVGATLHSTSAQGSSLYILVTFCSFGSSHLMGVRWHLTVVPMCTSLMISDAEHPLLCLLTIRLSSLEMSNQIFKLGCLIFVGQLPSYLFPGNRAS